MPAKIEGKFNIIGELCSCGHIRSRHKPHGIHENLDGHGPCEECDCEKFIWAGWVVIR